MTKDIELRGVTHSFGGPTVLEEVDLDVARGELLGLVGPNGGGKSTLLRVVLGLLSPTRGTVRVLGGTPAAHRVEIGYVPQLATFSRSFPITVLDTVLMGRLGRTRAVLGFTRRDREVALGAMDEMEITDLSRHPIPTLSGGQLQRTLIARALATEPRILLLDEPTSNVDLRAEASIFDVLARMRDRMTVVLVSHDLGFVTRHVSRVACLSRRLVCHQTTELTPEIIEKLYGAPVSMIRHDTDLAEAPGP